MSPSLAQSLRTVGGIVALVAGYELSSGKPFTISPAESERWKKIDVSVPAKDYLFGVGLCVVGAGLLSYDRVCYSGQKE